MRVQMSHSSKAVEPMGTALACPSAKDREHRACSPSSLSRHGVCLAVHPLSPTHAVVKWPGLGVGADSAQW